MEKLPLRDRMSKAASMYVYAKPFLKKYLKCLVFADEV